MLGAAGGGGGGGGGNQFGGVGGLGDGGMMRSSEKIYIQPDDQRRVGPSFIARLLMYGSLVSRSVRTVKSLRNFSVPQD